MTQNECHPTRAAKNRVCRSEGLVTNLKMVVWQRLLDPSQKALRMTQCRCHSERYDSMDVIGRLRREQAVESRVGNEDRVKNLKMVVLAELIDPSQKKAQDDTALVSN
jgi:hypothetical protein